MLKILDGNERCKRHRDNLLSVIVLGVDVDIAEEMECEWPSQTFVKHQFFEIIEIK